MGFGALGGMTVIIAATALVIGVFVMAQVQVSLANNTNSSTGLYYHTLNSNQSSAIFSTAYSAYSLITVMLIVLAAVAILAVAIEGIGGGFSLPKRKSKDDRQLKAALEAHRQMNTLLNPPPTFTGQKAAFDADGKPVVDKKKKPDGDFD